MPNPETAKQQDLRAPNDRNRYEVTAADLPIQCPLPGSSLWNSHPRIYIELDENGFGKCLYCGAEYVRTDTESD